MYSTLLFCSTLKGGLGEKLLAALSSKDVAEYRDGRLATGLKTQTVRHDLALLSRAIKQGMMEWGIALPAGNPVNRPEFRGGRWV